MDDHADQDLAADLKARGHTWTHIADILGTTPAVARRYAEHSDQRAHHRAHQHQLGLF